MCNKYTTCGKKHYPKWKVSKIKRNRRGQFITYRPMTALFLGIMFFGSVSMIGVNTIWSWAKSLEKTFVVENTRAGEVINNLTWQEEVMVMIKNAGLDTEKADKIIFCESSWKPDNFHYNKSGSLDRGLWQINNFYHPEVSKDCAYDPICATIQAIRIIKSKGWSEWSCNKLI